MKYRLRVLSKPVCVLLLMNRMRIQSHGNGVNILRDYSAPVS